MKIIINGRFLVHRVTGVERYAREIISELDRIINDENIEMVIPPEVNNIPNYKNIKVVKIGKLNNRLWEHISFPAYVYRQRGIALNLCNVAPLFNPGIVCIHDMKIMAHPEYFSKKFRLWYKLLFWNETKRAKKIITVSNFSKKEIMKYYNVPEDRIVVVPNAWQHFEKVGYDEDTLHKFNLEKHKYFFAMGSMEPNKNFKWIAETAKKNPYHTFAIAGSINEEVFAEGVGFKCPNNMKFLGYVTDEEAKTLMRDCKAFLFPSIYEGFGIPPLEAASVGCERIIVSDIEVMHEIFENSVEYISNKENESADIALYDRVLCKYSWKKSALKLLNEIKNLCKEIG